MKIKARIASTPSSREIGFQGQKDIKDNEGILFVFPQSQRLSFWMLNTPVPLDIAFINKNNRINQIARLNPYSTRIITSDFESKFALEIKQGEFEKNNINVGDIIEFPNEHNIVEAGKLDSFKNIFIRKKEKSNTEPLEEMNIDNEVAENIEDKKKDLEEKKENIYDSNKEEERGEDDILPEELEEYQDQDIKGKFEIPEVTENETAENIDEKKEDFPDTDPLQINQTIQEIIEYADIHGLNLKLLYRNSHGTILPEKILSPIDNKEYLFFNGPNGSYFKAFDNCATIYGDGWVIEGNKIKSFLYSRIIDLEIIM